MNETSIKGIVWDKISLDASNIAFIKKLEKFDCAVVLDEQGSHKRTKARIAVLDTVLENKKPSILLITTDKLMYGWYRTLVSGIGADFKFITDNEYGIGYFSPKINNFYIAGERSGKNPLFTQIKETGLVWDLVIIDGGLSKDGVNTDLILNGFDLKTKKLLVFASYIKSAPGEAEKLSKLPEKFLEDRAKAAYFSSNKPDSSVLALSADTPYGKYYGNADMAKPSIRTVLYKVSDEIAKAKADQNIAPLYCYGGNIFEDLTLDMRKIYNHVKYDDEMVMNLRSFDSKLNVFLDEISMLLEDPDNRIIAYFSSEKTLEYIYKVLSSPIIGLKRVTAVKKNKLYGIEDTNSCFNPAKNEDIRIVLSLDDQNERYDHIETITHVINYELPNSPITLHRRYRQGGRSGFAAPQVIFFRDEGDRFDGRMLSRVLALNFCGGYCFEIPGRNVYMYVDGLETMLADMLCELEGAEEFNALKLHSLAVKYNLRVSPEKAKDIICAKKNAIKRAFSISDDINERSQIENHIKERLCELRNGFCCFDNLGVLVSQSFDVKNSSGYAILSEEAKNDRRSRLKEEARELLRNCKGSEQILAEISKIDESDKDYVCYCAWRFLSESCGYKNNYNTFLKEIFEEVI